MRCTQALWLLHHSLPSNWPPLLPFSLLPFLYGGLLSPSPNACLVSSLLGMSLVPAPIFAAQFALGLCPLSPGFLLPGFSGHFPVLITGHLLAVSPPDALLLLPPILPISFSHRFPVLRSFGFLYAAFSLSFLSPSRPLVPCMFPWRLVPSIYLTSTLSLPIFLLYIFPWLPDLRFFLPLNQPRHGPPLGNCPFVSTFPMISRFFIVVRGLSLLPQFPPASLLPSPPSFSSSLLFFSAVSFPAPFHLLTTGCHPVVQCQILYAFFSFSVFFQTTLLVLVSIIGWL